MRISFLLMIAILIMFVLFAVPVMFAVRKRRNASKRIGELTVYAEGLKNLISKATEVKEKKRYEKKLKKIENKIVNLKLLTIPKNQYSQTDKLRYKLKITRRLLVAFLLITLLIAVIWIFSLYDHIDALYNTIFYEKDERYALDNEIYALNEEIDTLNDEISALNDEINILTNEASDLKWNADWFNERAKIVVADSGSLYNTYHTYDCERWSGKSLWIYNKEQVINNPEYTKCPDCNDWSSVNSLAYHMAQR